MISCNSVVCSVILVLSQSLHSVAQQTNVPTKRLSIIRDDVNVRMCLCVIEREAEVN